jgi:carbonic anhydrase
MLKFKFLVLLVGPVVILFAAGGHVTAAEPAVATPEVANTAPAKPVKPSSPRTIRAERANDERVQDELAVRIAERLAQLRADNAAKSSAAARVKARKARAVPVVSEIPVLRAIPEWSYEGATGPSNWAGLHPDWAICGNGVRQSPIDIRDGIKLDLEPIAFDYQPSSFTVQDNGHTIEVRLGSGSAITIMNRRYELQEFHFHRPSGERIDGKSFEMAVHLVHKDRTGKQAVMVLLLERGTAQETIQ